MKPFKPSIFVAIVVVENLLFAALLSAWLWLMTSSVKEINLAATQSQTKPAAGLNWATYRAAYPDEVDTPTPPRGHKTTRSEELGED